MSDQPIRFDSALSPADAAAAWLARHDRGLTAVEEREFAEWQSADPHHAEEYARLEAEWRSFDFAQADPELAAMARALDERTRPQARWRKLAWVGSLAAAAAVVLGTITWSHRSAPGIGAQPASSALTYQVVPSSSRQITLEDGSIVSLRGDSEVATDFTPAERRVRLLRGEAHFAVAKNPDRPFIVSAGGVAVRAVGTAFNVRMDSAAVEVLVTEGKVRVNDTANSQSLLSPSTTNEPPVLSAGERVIIDAAVLNAALASAKIDSVTPAEVEQVLAWQSTRLIFNRTPLGEAIEAFNRHESHGHRLVLGAESLSSRRLGGTFRADNADGFVRLLELSADVRAEQRADGTVVLWPAR